MLTPDLKRKFLDLTCALSPENLSCDGEISSAQVRARYKELKREWGALERQAGLTVTELMAWTWVDELEN